MFTSKRIVDTINVNQDWKLRTIDQDYRMWQISTIGQQRTISQRIYIQKILDSAETYNFQYNPRKNAKLLIHSFWL